MIRIMDMGGEIQRLEVERNGLLQRIASLEATITNLRTPPSPALIPELLEELREIGADRWTDSITPRVARILFEHIASLEARNEAMAAVVAAARLVVDEERWVHEGGPLYPDPRDAEVVATALATLDALDAAVTMLDGDERREALHRITEIGEESGGYD